MVGWYDKPKSNHPVFLALDFINWSIGMILLVLFLCKPSNRKHLNTLLEDSGWSSASESLMVKTMTSQVSNLSTDSKLSIRLRNSIIFGSQNKQILWEILVWQGVIQHSLFFCKFYISTRKQQIIINHWIKLSLGQQKIGNLDFFLRPSHVLYIVTKM